MQKGPNSQQESNISTTQEELKKRELSIEELEKQSGKKKKNSTASEPFDIHLSSRADSLLHVADTLKLYDDENNYDIKKLREKDNYGATALWNAAFVGPELVFKILEKIHSQVTFADLCAAPDSGPYQGISVLWLLAGLKPDRSFAEPTDKWITGNLVKPIITVNEEKLSQPGIVSCVLSLLAQRAAEGYPQAFLACWKFLKPLLNEAHASSFLRRSPPNRPHVKDGDTLIYLLAKAAYTGDSRPFMLFWQYFEKALSPDFLLQPTESGNYLLDMLVKTALEKNNPLPLLTVWKDRKNALCLRDFIRKHGNNPPAIESLLKAGRVDNRVLLICMDLLGQSIEKDPAVFLHVWKRFPLLLPSCKSKSSSDLCLNDYLRHAAKTDKRFVGVLHELLLKALEEWGLENCPKELVAPKFVTLPLFKASTSSRAIPSEEPAFRTRLHFKANAKWREQT